MKKKASIIAAVILTAAVVTAFAQGFNAAGQGRGIRQNAGPAGEVGLFADLIATLPREPLSAAEKEGLILLREEEKLARDVYLFLGEKWNARVFQNIAESEQTHMDYVKLLLDRYGVTDPVTSDGRGVFTNPGMAALYSELTVKGSGSLGEAFTVGALIEDLDIADLEKEFAAADNTDIRILYQNLNKGSRNHLRAFDRQLVRENVIYEPRYISATMYRKITDSRQETGGLIRDPNHIF